MRLLLFLSSILLVAVANTSLAETTVDNPFYVGVQTGYGNTDWARLVSQDDLSATATPVTATGDGVTYGLLAGYQVVPRIAIEAEYLHFADSHLTFMTPNVYNVTDVTSKTNYYALITKVFVLTNSDFRLYGDIGAARVTSASELADNTHTGLTFGFGADYSISEHWLGIFSFEYTPGTAVAAENASAQYVPYLYSLTLGMAYRF